MNAPMLAAIVNVLRHVAVTMTTTIVVALRPHLVAGVLADTVSDLLAADHPHLWMIIMDEMAMDVGLHPVATMAHLPDAMMTLTMPVVLPHHQAVATPIPMPVEAIHMRAHVALPVATAMAEAMEATRIDATRNHGTQ